MHKLLLYLKFQLPIIISLTLFIILPFTLVRLYLADVPYMHYFFLFITFFIKFFIMDDSQYSKTSEEKIRRYFQKKALPIPSKQNIFNMAQTNVYARNLSFGLCILVVLVILFLSE